MATPLIRVAIVDDHPVVRDGTAALLAAQDGLEIVGTAGSIDEAAALLARTAIDVLLLDIRLGTDSGLRLLAGGEVRLERTDGTRPPPEVELAIFRVAQEALANAVKHGRPPIVVRYRATEGGASLSVDDAGPGIAPDAAPTAEREGRFGLLNMEQRAQGIGAILDVRRWPSGGTHVALEWRPR